MKKYWIVEPRHKTIEKYFLVNKKYELEEKLLHGDISTKVIKGVSITVKAILIKQNLLKHWQIFTKKKGYRKKSKRLLNCFSLY